MNEQDNIKKLRNRNIFEEIKKIVTPIQDTASGAKTTRQNPQPETYEDIINDVFGDEE